MFDYPSLNGTGQQPPTRHGLLLLVRPGPLAATEIADRTDRFCDKAGLTGRRLSADRLHVTLFDLGEYSELPEELVVRVCRVMATIICPPIEVTFDRLQTFRRRSLEKPWVLVGGDGLNDLCRLRRMLALALIEAGLKKFARLSFTPHMTLLYDPRTIKPREIDPVRWTMTEFVLVDSLRGQTKHVPIARWQLRGEPNG
jgi:2'-5' RNA ligase